MFKIKFIQFVLLRGVSRGGAAWRTHKLWIISTLLLSLGCLTGCNTMPPLPPINLSEPGWTTLQGQAVWQPKVTAPEISGELIMATNVDGRSFVQFIKTPLPIVVAQTTPKSWQIHFVPNDKTYSGPGKPPSALIWLHLPRDLAGAKPPRLWSLKTDPSGTWRLRNSYTGESLEGYLNP